MISHELLNELEMLMKAGSGFATYDAVTANEALRDMLYSNAKALIQSAKAANEMARIIEQMDCECGFEGSCGEGYRDGICLRCAALSVAAEEESHE